MNHAASQIARQLMGPDPKQNAKTKAEEKQRSLQAKLDLKNAEGKIAANQIVTKGKDLEKRLKIVLDELER